MICWEYCTLKKIYINNLLRNVTNLQETKILLISIKNLKNRNLHQRLQVSS